MKSFHLSIFGVILLFVLVMVSVTLVAFHRESNRCKIDPAHMQRLRER